jgi:hypothetical protein
MATDQQHIQKHAELIHVGGGRRELAEKLLRRSVFGREHDLIDERARRFITIRPLSADQLGDAEIKQLDCAVASDEHVRRLEVAMHDQVAMRMRDRQHRIHEQSNPCLDVEVVRIAVPVDAIAIDVLQDQELLAVGSRAGIEQPRDVRMRQARQQPAFATKALAEFFLRDGAVQELDRALRFEAPVAAARKPHFAHAATAEQALDRVAADARAFERRAREGRQIREWGVLEELAGVECFALGQQLAQNPGDAGLRRRQLAEPMLALARREIERSIKIPVDLRPRRQLPQAD